MNIQQAILDSLEEGKSVLDTFVQDAKNGETLHKMSEILTEALKNGGQILSCGNGGSSCDSMHFAEELTGRYRGDRKALPAISLTDSSHLTCVGNDYGFDYVFSRGVEAYGKEGDVLIALSTSGNSKNIVRAVEAAQERKMKVLLFLGKTGGTLKDQGDCQIIAPGKNSDRIQEIHMMCLHILIEGIERNLFPENY
jgi:D-sedoheptulose 7-phosphate isomerase